MAELDHPLVLVVEDDPDLRDNLRMLLEEAGLRVVTAGTPTDAEALLVRDGVSAVLADFLLPGGTGLDLLRAARRRRPRVRGVLMTAFGEDYIKPSEVRKEGFEFVKKPFEAEEMVELVRRLVR